MKTALILILVLVSSSYCKQYEGIFIPHKEIRKDLVQKESYQEEDLLDLIKHNFGVLDTNASTKTSRLIELLGKGNFIKPSEMNYMFIVEGLSTEAAQSIQYDGTVPFDFELKEDNKHSLMDQIFDLQKVSSVISNVQKYAKIAAKAEFYMYSSHDVVSKFFEEYGIASNMKTKNSMEILDIANDEVLKSSNQIQTCVNDAFVNAYHLEKNTIHVVASWDDALIITPENAEDIQQFLKDVCAITQISKSFKRDDKPHFALFQIDSIGKLEKSLNAADFEIVKKMLKRLIKTTAANMEKSFGEESVFGKVLFTDNCQDEDLSGPKKSIKRLEEVKEQQQARRMLEETDYATTSGEITAEHYQIMCWFWVVLAFATFYVCYSMFNMSNVKDSILYAKFIAIEK